MAQERNAFAKKIETIPANTNPGKILSRPEESLDLFHRYPKPGEFLTNVPHYALVTHDDILVIKRRANTLAILKPGSYEINVHSISPSTDYFAFIRTSDYLMDWNLPTMVDTEKQEEVIIGLSGTMIFKVINIDLAAYNLIVTTRGMMTEFKQWLVDQINIILAKKKDLLLSMDSPPSEKFFTEILQQALEEPFSFLGLELKGIQVTQVKIITFPAKKPSSTFKRSTQKETLPLEQKKKLARPSTDVRMDKQQSSGKEKNTLALSMPSEVIIGFPKSLKVRFTTLDTQFPQEITIKAHSPSFLFHESEKTINLDRASAEVEFNAVGTKAGSATIHVSAYSANGTRLITSRIDVLVVRESYEVIGHLLKQYAISSVILFFGMIAGIIGAYWLRIDRVKIEALYVLMGTLLGLTLSALIAFAERSRK